MAGKPTYEQLEQRVRELEKRLIEHKRASERGLRASEEKFRTLFNNASDAIFIQDFDGQILEVNQIACDRLGYRRDELLHMAPTDFGEPELGLLVSKRLEELQEKGCLRFETLHVDRHGKSISVEIISQTIDYEGRSAIISTARDITERKRAEESLRESKEQTLLIINNLPYLIFQIDKDLKVLWTNKAANKINPEAVGQPCYKAFACRHMPCEDCNSLKAVSTGQIVTCTMHLPQAAGIQGETYWEQTAVPLRNDQGEVIGAIVLSNNITGRKRLEDRLQQAERLKAIGTLASGIAHEFNNLLMGILGNVSLMSLDIDTTHPHYLRLKNIKKQVQSGAKLTAHFLGYARKGKYKGKPVDLNALVREASDTFGKTRKGISIHQQLADALFAIEADSAQIEQVLWNLLGNADDAMPGGGDLILKTDNVTHEDMKGKVYDPKPGSYVRLMITDTGIGMDKETMQRIFDPFFTTKDIGRGTGLGLASAYGIIKGHAGYVDVESKKGHGTTFSIYLPSAKKEVQKVVKTAQEVIEGRETILLVDDEEIIVELGRDMLEAMGYRVLTARDGKEAVEIYKDNKDEIDLVILDMVMPRMAGGKAYDKMKEIDPNVKVLLSSGYSMDSEAKEILARGCDAFIQKPFGMEGLSQKIREVLQKK